MATETNTEDWKINHLEIKNFKSIKELNIDPARVNIFIGKPNAGKSNILEALTFMSQPFTINAILPENLLRYKSMASLFYDYNNKDRIEFIINDLDFLLSYRNGTYEYSAIKKKVQSKNDRYEVTNKLNESIATIDENATVSGNILSAKRSSIYKYHFKNIPSVEQTYSEDRLRFDGSNIWRIIRHSSDLKKFATSFVKEFGLKVLFQKDSNKFDLMKIEGDSYTLIDFVLTPDTFQRMLYYLAAIDSNRESVLLFEEPEANSYPYYIQMLSERIIDDQNNQYFITTHSPFVVEKMLERAGTNDDVKIFVTYYENDQTKVRELSKADIDEVISNSVDLFFNMEAYQK